MRPISNLGELTTSIAHEIKQPLSAIPTNARTRLRLLDKAEPNLDKLVKLTTWIVESAQRASDIIGPIQDMAGKRPSQHSLIGLNAMIHDGPVFLRHECADKGVRVQLEPGADLPSVQAIGCSCSRWWLIWPSMPSRPCKWLAERGARSMSAPLPAPRAGSKLSDRR
ncbi:histidine kinase dimerization/phospho-acceptor domain-containing protein [Devosia beringensis]|uniref:histidine kinase dimerization/phospho-acceptor domain-containing protein n=1 Tax=Devosia beringensis TaxID=2657486 RepID=UPI00186B69A7|nr:histidine kinase dimerization/phospho-acceptor domain-containing protein [Devosia beringensis]